MRSRAAPTARHPRLRCDLRQYVETLFDLAARSLTTYQDWKLQRRLLDFTDLETTALRLLHREDVAERLRERLEVVLVDETA